MDYKVIWSPQAVETLGEAVSYVARDNPSAARKLGVAILEKAQLLGRFPRLGKIFAKLAREDVRETPASSYRMIYHVQDHNRSVTVLTVWHGARKEPDLWE